MRKRAVSGRGWAYIGAALGGIVSVAANVAHSYVPPPGVPDGWSPQGGAVIGAIFWPVGLFVAVEILARVPWPTGRKWWWLRFGGLLPVAAVAALVSYRHLSGLLRFYGEDGITATLGPLAVDGLMVVATGALLVTARRITVDSLPVEVAADVTVTAPEPPPAPTVDATPTVKPAAAKRVTRKPASAAKVARAAAKMPGATVAAIAAKAGVSESTARRHLPAPAATVASPIAPVAAETPTLIAA